jgi:hypothetical protein
MADAPYDERSRMGQISGGLWILGALVSLAGTFLPGASHQDIDWVVILRAILLAYEIASDTGQIQRAKASIT